jgi:hypothetical protein
VVNGGKEPLLASIDMNRARADPYFTSGDYAHISFPKSPLLRLLTSEVAHLSVALTRPGGRINYPLEDGPPTIVELEVSMGSEAEFTMTVHVASARRKRRCDEHLCRHKWASRIQD